jgi:hypothetical protein
VLIGPPYNMKGGHAQRLLQYMQPKAGGQPSKSQGADSCVEPGTAPGASSGTAAAAAGPSRSAAGSKSAADDEQGRPDT